MNAQIQFRARPQSSPVLGGVLQRKCACGGTPGPTGECAACRRKRLGIQHKLTINQPGDRYEREADRVAEQVMRMPEPRLQRQTEPDDDEEEEELLQTKPLAQRQGAGQASAGAAPPIVHDALRSPGRPLDPATCGFMESRFGHDFSQVRVHTDEKAAESAQAVNARAYTVGHNIAFGARQYAPKTSKGQKLIAHELAHVVQQSGTESTEPIASSVHSLQGSANLQRLGDNPSCTDDEARGIHQAIFDARGWLNKAIPKLEATPLSALVLGSLRRNFGSTYGVAENATLIRNRLSVARTALGRIPFSCDTAGTTAFCAANHCGWATFGSNEATICTNPTSTLDIAWPFAARCVLHESLHAAMSFMTEDVYLSDPAYPGAGTQPLKNPASYTKLAMDLS